MWALFCCSHACRASFVISYHDVAPDVGLSPSGRRRMGLEPQRASGHGRVDLISFPPSRLTTAPVDLPMVPATYGDGVLITHFSRESAALCKSKVVGV